MWSSSTPSSVEMWQLILIIWSIGIASGCDNCTDDSVTREELYPEGRSRSSLAWLVTPALFFVGVVYVVYKCCKDGLCNCRRLRQRAAQEHQQEHGYIPLSEVAVYASSVPEGTDLPGHRQLVLVHNQTFCVTFSNPPQRLNNASQSHPPSYEESLLHNDTAQAPEVQVVTNPPSYISSNPPRYSVAMGEPSPRPSISDDASPAGIILISERPRQLKFISQRRRHRSAQDTRTKQDRRRHFSAQDHPRKPLLSDDGETELDETVRQRCFSFNALKDAFSRRSQQNVPECESLLAQDSQVGGGDGMGGTDSVFSSREVVSSPGTSISPAMAASAAVAASASSFLHNNNSNSAMVTRTLRRPPQQVSFEDRILEESSENLNTTTTATTAQSSDLTNSSRHSTRLRQRHFSAPDRAHTQNYKSRHASGGNT